MYRINFRQEKTDGAEYLYILKTSQGTISEREYPSARVSFILKILVLYITMKLLQ